MLRDAAERLSVVADANGGEVFSLGSDDFVIVIDDFKEESEMYSLQTRCSLFAIPFPLGTRPMR